jgi:hypothetical protein
MRVILAALCLLLLLLMLPAAGFAYPHPHQLRCQSDQVLVHGHHDRNGNWIGAHCRHRRR